MGCGCSADSSRGLANYIYKMESFGTAIALMMIIVFLLVTTLGMLALGVGLGYNYCYVDFKVKRLFDENKQPRRFMDRQRREAGNEPAAVKASEKPGADIEPNMIVSLKNNISFLTALISRIKELNRNITLEFVAR